MKKNKYTAITLTEEKDGFYITMDDTLRRPGEPRLKLKIAVSSREEAEEKVNILRHIVEATMCHATGEKYVWPVGMEQFEEGMPAYLEHLLKYRPPAGIMSN